MRNFLLLILSLTVSFGAGKKISDYPAAITLNSGDLFLTETFDGTTNNKVLFSTILDSIAGDGENLGNGAPVFKQRDGSEWQFHSITNTDGKLLITLSLDRISINASANMAEDSEVDAAVAPLVATNNGAHYVTATATTTPRSVQERFGERPSAPDFGADRTGVTNSYLAIQTALDAVTNTASRVLIVPGTNRVESALTLPKRFTVEGPTPENGSDIATHRTLVLIVHTNDAILINTNDTGTASAVVLRNLRIQRDGGSTNRLVRLNDVTGALMEGLFLHDDGNTSKGIEIGPNTYFTTLERSKIYSDGTNSIGLNIVYPSTVNMTRGNMFQLANGYGVRVDSPNYVSLANNHEFNKVGLKLATNSANQFGPYGSVSLGDHFENNSEAGLDFSEINTPIDFTLIAPQFALNGQNIKAATNRALQSLVIIGGSGHDSMYGNANAELAAQLRNFRVYAESYNTGVRTRFEQVYSAANSYGVYDFWSGATNSGLRAIYLWKNTNELFLELDQNGNFKYSPVGANPTFQLDSKLILTNGLLGVGTVTPTNAMVAAASSPALQLDDTQNRDDWGHFTELGKMLFTTRDGSGNGAGPVAKIALVNRLGTVSPFGELAFYVAGPNRTFGNPRMLIDYQGFVGVGLTNPAFRLDVSGTAQASAFTGAGFTNTAATASKIAVWNASKGLVSGTVSEGDLMTESEALSTFQPIDADLSDLADGSLTGGKIGPGIDAGNITAGTLSVNRFNNGSGASSTTYLRGDGTWSAITGDGDGRTEETLQTTDDTVTSVETFSPASSTLTVIFATAVALRSDGAYGASKEMISSWVKNSSGTLTRIGQSFPAEHYNSATEANYLLDTDSSGGGIRLTVQNNSGDGQTLNWKVQYRTVTR